MHGKSLLRRSKRWRVSGSPIPGGGGRFGGMFNEFKPDPSLDFSKTGGLFSGFYRTFVDSPQGLWEGFVEELKGDVKSAATVPGGYKTKKSGVPTVEELEDQYEENALPGALDPQVYLGDLAKNPVDALWQQTKKGINWEDIDRRSKAAFVNRLITGKDPQHLGEGWAQDAYAKRTFQLAKNTDRDTSADFLRLTGRGVYKDKEVDTFGGGKKTIQQDVYADVGQALQDLNLNIDVASLRRTKHNIFLNKSAGAVMATLDQMMEDSARWNAINDRLSANDKENLKVAVEGFKVRHDVGKNIDSLSGNLKDLNKKLGKYYHTQDSALADKIKGDLGKVKGTVDSGLENINKVRDFYTANNSGDLLESFNKAVSPYEKTLQKLQNDLGASLATDGDLTTFINAAGSDSFRARFTAESLSRKFTAIKKEIDGKDFLQQGSMRKYMTYLMENELLEGNDTRQLGALISILDDDALNTLPVWVNRMREDRIRHSNSDLIRLADDGKLTKTFVYSNRIKPRFSNYTASHFVGEALGRMHYFGLKIDEDYLSAPDKDKAFLFRPFQRFVKGEGAFSKVLPVHKLFEHRIKIDLGDAGKLTTQGGKHFKAAIFFTKKFFSKDDANKLTMPTIIGMLTTSNKDDFITRFGDITRDNLDGDKFFDEIMAFKGWLQKYGRYLGLVDENGKIIEENFEKFLAWINKRLSGLGKIDYIELTRQYAGLIEKFSQFINLSQSKILQNFGKFISPLSHIKTSISEKLADIGARIVAKLFTAATEGAGVVVERAVKFVAQAVIKKTLDGIEAVVKGDWAKFDEMTTKTLAGIFKALAIILLIPGLLLYIGASGISAITNTIPEDNPTKVGYEGSLTGAPNGNLEPLPPGEQSGACVGQVEEGLQCVQVNGRPSNALDAGSYTPGGRGHGTNGYWSAVGQSCTFSIPWLPDHGVAGGTCPYGAVNSPCGPSNDSASFCKSGPLKPYYGYAMDVKGEGIYLPVIEGVEEWSVGNALRNNLDGANILISYADADVDGDGDIDARYKMSLHHIGGVCVFPGTYPAGQKVATGYAGTFGNHVHVELGVTYDGTTYDFLPPEDYITGCGI